MRISDWSSDVCSSDLTCRLHTGPIAIERRIVTRAGINVVADMSAIGFDHVAAQPHDHGKTTHELTHRPEEHTSELQSLMRISYSVFCVKKNITHTHNTMFTINMTMKINNRKNHNSN